jgi:hypothetical protein
METLFGDTREPVEEQEPLRESVEDLIRGFLGADIHESREKQSQSCSPKKSGFRV